MHEAQTHHRCHTLPPHHALNAAAAAARRRSACALVRALVRSSVPGSSDRHRTVRTRTRNRLCSSGWVRAVRSRSLRRAVARCASANACAKRSWLETRSRARVRERARELSTAQSPRAQPRVCLDSLMLPSGRKVSLVVVVVAPLEPFARCRRRRCRRRRVIAHHKTKTCVRIVTVTLCFVRACVCVELSPACIRVCKGAILFGMR